MAPHATNNTSPRGYDRPSETDPRPAYRSMPVEFPCLSYWHRTTRAFELLHSNSNVQVPKKARYVIIGSGLSGSLVAWELLQAGVQGNDVVILEAREAVSGASGRNAGHVRPDAFRGFAAYAATHGNEQAIRIIQNEKRVFERIDEFVKTHRVPCDFESTTTFDVCLTPEFAAYEAESLEAYKAAGGAIEHVRFYGCSEAKERTKVAGAIAAYEWPAGSIHPAKLTQWLLSEAVQKGVGLWTHCSATEVRKDRPECATEDTDWIVQTTRGAIMAEVVVHCTNAYAAQLLPELRHFITPNKAQAHSFIPTRTLSGSGVLRSTMSLRYSLHQFFSLIQRRDDGAVIFGASRTNPEWSEETNRSLVGFDDTSYNQEVASSCEREFTKFFPEPVAAPRRHGEGVDHSWSGIIAMTPDSVPLVGHVEGKRGQWICAGFNGHGMARIFTAAPAVVKLIMGEPWQATGLPQCFDFSTARLLRADEQQLKSVW